MNFIKFRRHTDRKKTESWEESHRGSSGVDSRRRFLGHIIIVSCDADENAGLSHFGRLTAFECLQTAHLRIIASVTCLPFI